MTVEYLKVMSQCASDAENSGLLLNAGITQNQATLIERPRHALRRMVNKCCYYKKRCQEKDERMKRVFNEDQSQMLITGSSLH